MRGSDISRYGAVSSMTAAGPRRPKTKIVGVKRASVRVSVGDRAV